MNNKILIGIIVFLVTIIVVGVFCRHSNYKSIDMNTGEKNTMSDHCSRIPNMDECKKNETGKNGSEHSMNMSHDKITNSSSEKMPIMPGQEAFGTIQEIINILDKDPNTDWNSVSIDNLRNHLIDMDQLTMYSHVEREDITNGLKMTVTGSGIVLDAINRMVPTHKQMTIDNIKNWNTTIENINNGVVLTVTSDNTNEVKKIRGLGFIGIMAIGSEHQVHHLMMAKGEMHMIK